MSDRRHGDCLARVYLHQLNCMMTVGCIDRVNEPKLEVSAETILT